MVERLYDEEVNQELNDGDRRSKTYLTHSNLGHDSKRYALNIVQQGSLRRSNLGNKHDSFVGSLCSLVNVELT